MSHRGRTWRNISFKVGHRGLFDVGSSSGTLQRGHRGKVLLQSVKLWLSNLIERP